MENDLGPLAADLEASLKAAVWLHSADAGAVSLARAQARLLDTLISDPEKAGIVAPIFGRYQALLNDLLLAPLSRRRDKQGNLEVDNGEEYSAKFDGLRQAATKDKAGGRRKPGTAS